MASNTAKKPIDNEQELMEAIFSFKYDPLGFVLYAFPWGVKGTPLERFPAPRRWQVKEFEKIKAHIQRQLDRREQGLDPEPLYLAISSGRGPGKSAFLSMLDIWFASCWVGGTGIVTANTETQLRTRTMAELGKWHTLAINSHWFYKTSMSLKPAQWFENLIEEQLKIDTQYYYIEAQSWSDDNPDAFAGAHSQIAMMVQFDEASGISDPIWQVTEGFFTDLSLLRIWVTISNPRRNTGRFFDCFHKDAEFWDGVYIDSREVEGIDKEVYLRIAKKYGEDSDETRVEVRGLFPRTGSKQFIGRGVVADASQRMLEHRDPHAPLLMGVDVARFGDDSSVIRFRQGRDAKSIPPKKFKRLDTMELVVEVAKLADYYNPDRIFVDGGGVGGGVIDRLSQLDYPVTEVQSGEKSRFPDKYMNKRVEMWAEMRDWLMYGSIDDSQELMEDLTGPEYEIDLKGRIKLETKESMKKRGLSSPDDADALGLTFAFPVASRDLNLFDELNGDFQDTFSGRNAVTGY